MKVLLAAALLPWLSSSPVLAADECRLELSPARLDFGSANRVELLSHPAASGLGGSFGVRTFHLRIQCVVPGSMTWGFIAPMADAQRYRWTAGTFQIRVMTARLDGAPVQLRRTGDDPADADVLRPADRMIPWRDGVVASGRHLEVELQIEAGVDDGASRVRDLTRHELHGTLVLD